MTGPAFGRVLGETRMVLAPSKAARIGPVFFPAHHPTCRYVGSRRQRPYGQRRLVLLYS